MNAFEFLEKHKQAPTGFITEELSARLSRSAASGLEGRGGLPMIPSYLSENIDIPNDAICAVMDAGGTNLRTALARFANGRCFIEDIQTVPMPASGGETLSSKELYSKIAEQLRRLGEFSRIGCCFSYLVDIERNLDGKLREWCKEIRSPDSVGKYVGKSLSEELGKLENIAVLNDSTAAMLGAKASLPKGNSPFVGLIVGTGINICYSEKRELITKLEEDIHCDSMIISTEVGEFDGIEPSDFEREVILSTDDPKSAQAEKQCSGAYLAGIVERTLQGAVSEGLIACAPSGFTLAELSEFLGNREASFGKHFKPCDLDFVEELCRLSVLRAASISALLCSEFVLRSASAAKSKQVRIAAEGSLFWKMHGFKEAFECELAQLLEKDGITFTIEKADNPCLEGAALAAFAQGH